MPTWAAAPYAHWFIANATNSLGYAVFVVTSWKKSMRQMMKLFLLLAGTIVFSAELAAHSLLLLLLTFPPFCLLFKYFTDVIRSWLSSPTHFQQFCWVCIFSLYGARIRVRATHANTLWMLCYSYSTVSTCMANSMQRKSGADPQERSISRTGEQHRPWLKKLSIPEDKSFFVFDHLSSTF